MLFRSRGKQTAVAVVVPSHLSPAASPPQTTKNPTPTLPTESALVQYKIFIPLSFSRSHRHPIACSSYQIDHASTDVHCAGNCACVQTIKQSRRFVFRCLIREYVGQVVQIYMIRYFFQRTSASSLMLFFVCYLRHNTFALARCV